MMKPVTIPVMFSYGQSEPVGSMTFYDESFLEAFTRASKEANLDVCVSIARTVGEKDKVVGISFLPVPLLRR